MEDSKKILAELTLEEKASLASGKTFWTTKPIERLGVPSVLMTDGPHGLRKEQGAEEEKGLTNVMKGSEKATCFPTAVTTASTWDPELLARVGKAIGEEAKDQGVSTVLGPGTNIKRSPLCGRNFEYFSEDPFLAGEMSAAYVNGMQEIGVGCSLKHYCGNNQEYFRMSIDSIIDERALREIYLPAFEKTVKRAQPWQVMCSYNKLNGDYLSDNKRMLTDILRKEWNFEGIVVSDWGATNDRVEGVRAGMDLQMPTCKGADDRKIVKAVKAGELNEEELNVTTERVLDYVKKCVDNKPEKPFKADYDAHHTLCREVGAKGAVLLKNNGALPLSSEEKIVLVGKLAEESRYQGAGSSRIECNRLIHLTQALSACGRSFDYYPGYVLEGEGKNDELLLQAVEAAKGANKVVAVIGLTDLYESEGFDRTRMDLPAGHNELIEKLCEVNDNVVVVLQGGSPVTMPWKDKVAAILNVYLQGEAVGESTMDVLYGDVNPGGKLAETYPLSSDDVLAQKCFPMGPKTVEYRESIFVGYRYFDTAKKDVAYPFGFGLSYTDFKVSDFSISGAYNEKFTVSCTVTNTGKREGSEVVQIYVGQVDSPIFKAEKELKGFRRVYLAAGESKRVEIPLNERAFSFYNTAVSDWSVLAGTYRISVGTSSRDILWTTDLSVAAPEVELPVYNEEVVRVYGNIGAVEEITKDQFEALYGKTLPDNEPYKVGEFHQNCTLSDLLCTRLGRFLCKTIQFFGKKMAGDAVNAAMVVNTVTSIPLRAFSGFSGGVLSPYSVDGLVDVFNKKRGGWRKFFRGFRKKYR